MTISEHTAVSTYSVTAFNKLTMNIYCAILVEKPAKLLVFNLLYLVRETDEHVRQE